MEEDSGEENDYLKEEKERLMMIKSRRKNRKGEVDDNKKWKMKKKTKKG